LRRQKNLPPSALKQKDPGFGRFSRSSFERSVAFFLNRSVELKTRNLIAQSENDRWERTVLLAGLGSRSAVIGPGSPIAFGLGSRIGCWFRKPAKSRRELHFCSWRELHAFCSWWKPHFHSATPFYGVFGSSASRTYNWQLAQFQLGVAHQRHQHTLVPTEHCR
jgi:hypothetical protein